MLPSDAIQKHFRLIESQKKALKKLGLETLHDLLFHLPLKYENINDIKNISDLKKDDVAILYGKITGLKTRKAFRSNRPIAEGTIEDATGKIKIIWFNQPYIAKMVTNDSAVKLTGKITGSDKNLYVANPEIEKTEVLPTETPDSLFTTTPHLDSFYPTYQNSRGITSKWFYHKIQKILSSDILDELADPIPVEILKRYNLPSLKTALVWIHTPQKERDSISARKRFAFEEVFFIQVAKQKERHAHDEEPSFTIPVEKKNVTTFVKRFPFVLTTSQDNAIKEILDDFKTPTAMSRLLEGDVGSGKTAVAATTAYAVTATPPKNQNFGNLQTAYMAPTEILAKQHFESFIEYFAPRNDTVSAPVFIGLITSSGCKKFPSKVDPTKATDISRTQLLKWVQNGEIPILIGTHSLIQKTVQFKNLAYVIIDEQHRFGTMQRQKLVRKDAVTPHLLSMTATPIPRTLALTIYGDLDLTLLDEMPTGRKPIITEMVTNDAREQTYEKAREQLRLGRQVYVICPRIDEPDETKATALRVKSVKEEAKHLQQNIFKEYAVDILHSKMRPNEKEETMEQFSQNKIQILVATSVIEVGVNIPNATTIIIEGADRFGLAQLHQLRGRVLRSSHQAYCFVFTDSKSKNTSDRLRALKTAKNGFELAEHDLKLRGAGELGGRRQWGMSDIAMEAMKNIKMVEAARTEAKKIIEKDPLLKKHNVIQKHIDEKYSDLHFE